MKSPSFVYNDMRKVGRDLKIARLRRNLSIRNMAERAGVSMQTISRLEKGEPNVSAGLLLMVMHILGMRDHFSGMADIAKDDIGLMLSIESLPKRARPASTRSAEI